MLPVPSSVETTDMKTRFVRWRLDYDLDGFMEVVNQWKINNHKKVTGDYCRRDHLYVSNCVFNRPVGAFIPGA